MATNPVVTPPPDASRVPWLRDKFIDWPWLRWLMQLYAAAKASVISGVNGSIQYNDSGVQAGDANLTWNKTTQTETIVASPADSALRIDPLSIATFGGADYIEIDFGQHVTAGTNIAEAVNPAQLWWDDSGGLHLEVDGGETPGSPVTFAAIAGLAVLLAESAAFSKDATGAVAGGSVGARRNAAGSGAASTLFGEQRSGTRWYIWQDATGAMRFGPARPTEDGSVSDTSGTPFGTGSGSVTSINATVPTSEFAVGGVPITTAGTIAITKQNQNANLVWAGPTSGGAAQPTFRALVSADIPAGAGVAMAQVAARAVLGI